jgi:leucyl-tRNA synthetase
MFTQGMVVHETYRRADGTWASPAEVRVSEANGVRSAVEIASGAPVEIGGIEKMSKSKRNTVDPTDIIATYGADTARWFMLSDSPPDRDVIWTEEGVAGAHRFVQRVYRLVGDSLALGERLAPTGAAVPAEMSPAAIALRKEAHRALAGVEDNIRALRFNVAVARIYELVNAISAAVADLSRPSDGPPDRSLAAALREALELLVRMFAPMMPHLAEECWALLGHRDLVAMAPWPAIDHSLLVEDRITLPVQVNGRKRGELTIPTDASQADVETATLALEAVRRALGGHPPKKIVVVPKRIVNVVI